MNRALARSLISMAVAGTLAAATWPAAAQTGETIGYLIDQRNVFARSGTGLCWRTGYWTPAMAHEACDPDLVKKPAPPPVAAAPAEPAPPPPPPAPRALPTVEKLSLSADALFDFDKATLRPEGRTAIERVAEQFKDASIEVVIVVGHADRIGTEKYNLRLSERRAESVKAHLVSRGMDANRIHSEGKGEAQPVTGDKCRKLGPENRRNRKLVDCLQPDRRVEIELIGTRQRP